MNFSCGLKHHFTISISPLKREEFLLARAVTLNEESKIYWFIQDLLDLFVMIMEVPYILTFFQQQTDDFSYMWGTMAEAGRTGQSFKTCGYCGSFTFLF